MAEVAIEPLVYNVPQAAQALQVCPNTIRNLIRRGELPASKIGDRVLIRREAVATFLDEKEMLSRLPNISKPDLFLTIPGVPCQSGVVKAIRSAALLLHNPVYSQCRLKKAPTCVGVRLGIRLRICPL